jgi:FkbM family methyltransferase
MGVFSNVGWFDRLRLVASIPVAFVRYVRELFSAYLMPLAGATPDWPQVVLVYFGIRKSARIRLNGKTTEITRPGIRALIFGINNMRSEGRGSTDNYLRIYDPLRVRGRTVIDVGAYIGDSPLYFVRRGASGVIGFEPAKSLYAIGVRNVASERMQKRITMVNKAVVPERRSGKFSGGFSMGLSPEELKGGMSIGEMIRKYKLSGAAMKLDCEGGEYGLLRSLSAEESKAFDEIAVRYYRGYRNVEEKLRSLGYSTRHTKPAYSFANLFRTFVARGVVYAKRIG